MLNDINVGLRIEGKSIVLYELDRPMEELILTTSDHRVNVAINGSFDLRVVKHIIQIIDKIEYEYPLEKSIKPKVSKEDELEQEIPKEKEKPIYNYKPWNRTEDDFIKINHDKMNIEEIAQRLGRTEASIRNRIYKLNPNKGTYGRHKNWTKEDIDYLKKNYSEMTNKDIGKALNRSEGAVSNKAFNLSLDNGLIGINTSKSGLRWSEKDINYLKKHYSDLSLGELAEKLKRSKRAIVNKVKELGIPERKEKKEWTDEDTEILKETYGEMSSREIARILDRTVGSVDTRISKLGLPKKKK